MDDYIIDEKLLRDIQEATYIPTPYPPRSEQGIFTSTNPPKPILNNTNHNEKKRNNINNNNIVSNRPPKKNFSYKEYNELEQNFINLSKQYEKSEQKLQNQIEVMKKTKNSYENLIKEYTLLQKTNEKLSKDKISLEVELTELKAYNRKIETRLVSGAKNQNVIEINNKIRNENEELIQRIFTIEKEKNELILQNKELTNQILILNKSVNSNISPEKLIEISNIENGYNELQQKYIFLNEQNENFKDLLLKNEEKIQELIFVKTHLTELLASKENEINSLKIERDSFSSRCETSIREIKGYKEKLSSFDNIVKQNESLKNEVESIKSKINSKIGKENEKLLEELKLSQQKLNEQESNMKEIEINYKDKLEQYYNENNNLYQEKEKYKSLYNEIIEQFNNNTLEEGINDDESLFADTISLISLTKNKNIELLNKIMNKKNEKTI